MTEQAESWTATTAGDGRPGTWAGRVVDVATHVVTARYSQPFGISSGTSRELTSVAVTLRTDQGFRGVGEATPMTAYTGEHLPGILAGVEILGKVIIGLDATKIRAAHQAMDAALRGNRIAKAALDLALHDLTAQAFGVSVSTLLGGAVRSYVPMAWVIGLGEIDNVVREAVARAERGFAHIKVKGGLDPRRDIEVVKALRTALPDAVELSMDANEGYDRAVARRTLTAMQDIGLDLVEQPLPRWDIDGMAMLTEHLEILVMADESVQSAPEAMMVAHRRAADVVNLKLLKLGGFRPALDVAAIADAAGLRVKVGSMPELGAATLAAAHLAAVLPNATVPADLVGPLMVDRDPFLGGSFTVTSDGAFELPAQPGLGLDWKADRS